MNMVWMLIQIFKYMKVKKKTERFAERSVTNTFKIILNKYSNANCIKPKTHESNIVYKIHENYPIHQNNVIKFIDVSPGKSGNS